MFVRLLTGRADALLLLLFIQVIKDPPPPPPPSRPPPPVSHKCFIFRFENPCGAKEEEVAELRVVQHGDFRETLHILRIRIVEFHRAVIAALSV